MADREKRRTDADPVSDIRAGFDGILSALGEALSDISSRIENGNTGEVHRSFDMDTAKGPLRAEAGVRVRFAGQEIGSTAPRRRAPTTPVNAPRPATRDDTPLSEAPVRKMDHDIVEDDETWRLTADIPGVGREDLVLDLVENTLIITTTGTRRFRGEASLPPGIALDDITVSLRNGILELSCPHGGEAGG
ncbi:Hsp20 family protein [Alphaproteobacteria bacterium GH1-50]|uniref:Hsp20 family protein n=1 Tax=Kangsaoukella pontilimi TaxID=2691042 RepID=A0A7C9J312_9RHOB|nr:Hsp20/alpha crystallin family protein [Kangsaoukella pontilimi]MXQ07941.1 Hsp20 family protein [Kangsaoukella pontilimi]